MTVPDRPVPRRPVLFTGEVFRQQSRGGITRYVLELTRRMRRPCAIVAGLHQSAEIPAPGIPVRAALRLPRVRGAQRAAAPLNAALDACWLAWRRGAIVQPTYYRDPRGLPSGAPVVVTVHDMTHERLPGHFTERWWSAGDAARHKAELCRRAERVLCNSAATRQDVIDLLGLPATKVRLTPFAGRDWSPIRPEPLPGSAAPFFLWVGGRHGYKNFLPTLQAWAACRAAGRTHLLCVGGGPLEDEERRTLEALGVASRVRQRACTDGELRWAYEQAAGLVYTSLWEGFGMPVLEAMALGCPVVASDRAALREVGGTAALYAEPADPDSLRAVLGRCLAETREPDAVAARQANAARFSWDRCALLHEAVYAELD